MKVQAQESELPQVTEHSGVRPVLDRTDRIETVLIGLALSACTCAIAALANTVWPVVEATPSAVGWWRRLAVGYSAVVPFVVLLSPTVIDVVRAVLRRHRAMGAPSS